MIAGLAMGKTVCQSVSQRVAPNARLPSLIVLGIRASPSSVLTMTTGKVNKARVSQAKDSKVRVNRARDSQAWDNKAKATAQASVIAKAHWTKKPPAAPWVTSCAIWPSSSEKSLTA